MARDVQEFAGHEGLVEVGFEDGVKVRYPDGFPDEAYCPDCKSWYPWLDQELSCVCGWVPPKKRDTPEVVA